MPDDAAGNLRAYMASLPACARLSAVGLERPAGPVSSFGANCGNIRCYNQAALIEALKRYDAALRENDATGLFIFGSRAVGTQRPDSDLDLFIDSDPETKIPNLFRLMQISRKRLIT